MANHYGGWEIVGEPIGRGGQGTVYLARSPERGRQRRAAADGVKALLRQTPSGLYEPTELAERLAQIFPDPPDSIGALKKFEIRDDEAEAVGRLRAEIQALSSLKDHPAILKLRECNANERFIVTEYHPAGTLDKHLCAYKGQILRSLESFRPLVDAVVKIHGLGAIHRDIKPENIFVASDGRLVLGDFGIVFLAQGQRLTQTDERVGSHFWMAPWAYDNRRLALEEIKPSLDIFPLAKVLWSMIAGHSGFPYWWYDRDQYDLTKMFPEDPLMSEVNILLSKCIVDREENCMTSAETMLLAVDQLVRRARNLGRRPTDDGPWPCRICGLGLYIAKSNFTVISHVASDSERQRLGVDRIPMQIYACNRCGHVELFQPNR